MLYSLCYVYASTRILEHITTDIWHTNNNTSISHKGFIYVYIHIIYFKFQVLPFIWLGKKWFNFKRAQSKHGLVCNIRVCMYECIEILLSMILRHVSAAVAAIKTLLVLKCCCNKHIFYMLYCIWTARECLQIICNRAQNYIKVLSAFYY